MADVAAGVHPQAQGVPEAQQQIFSEVGQLAHQGVGEGGEPHPAQVLVYRRGDRLAAGGGEHSGFQGVAEDKQDGPQDEEGEQDAKQGQQDP